MAQKTEQAIDHDDQLQKMVASWLQPIVSTMQDERVSHTGMGHIRRLVRTAIEQAFDAGHDCARQNNGT